jgi:AcrR family transcriptional regulator
MPVRKSSGSKSAFAQKPTLNRGPKPSLSRDRVARAAIHLADEEGLASLTMQKLACEVGLTTMALYRYFPGKADVVALMIDSVADSPPHFGAHALPWQTRLKRWAHRCLTIYLDHPWFLEATTTRRTSMGANELSWMEAALAMLAESGLEAREQHHAFVALIGHIRGYATFQQIGGGTNSGKEWARQMSQLLQTEKSRYPVLLDVLHSGAFSVRTTAAFDFGLDCIVLGISARIIQKGR